LEGPRQGAEVSASGVDACQKNAPGADSEEIEPLEASDAGAAFQGGGEGTEPFGEVETEMGGCGIGDEEGTWREGEEGAREPGGSFGNGREAFGG
jgi:hypothetical protein